MTHFPKVHDGLLHGPLSCYEQFTIVEAGCNEVAIDVIILVFIRGSIIFNQNFSMFEWDDVVVSIHLVDLGIVLFEFFIMKLSFSHSSYYSKLHVFFSFDFEVWKF